MSCAPRASRATPQSATRRLAALRMSPAKREEIYSGLARAMPEPKSELEHTTPYELLVAVVLSAQATDKSVNLATQKLYPSPTRREKIAALGVEGLEQYIRTIGLYRGKAKNVIALSQILMDKHGGEVPRTREDAGGAARRRAQDRERGAERRVRGAHHRRGYARLPRLQPHAASHRARIRSKSR
jgi:hypothetical protein